MEGRVLVAQTMQPAENVVVDLVRLGAMQDRKYTDSRGEFEFTRLAMVEYILRVRHPGYLPIERMVNMNLEVGGRGSVFNVTLMLEVDPSNPPKSNEPGRALTARELQVPEAARKEFDQGFEQLNRHRRPEQGIPHFQKAIELHRDFDEAYVQLGLAYYLVGQRANSLRTLAKATEIYPENARAYALLGKVLIAVNQIDPAIQALEEALDLDETQWGAHTDLATALLQQKQMDGALAHARRAFELNSTVPLTHVLLATVLMERKEYAEAVKIQDQFLKQFPNEKLADEVRKQRDAARKQLKRPTN